MKKSLPLVLCLLSLVLTGCGNERQRQYSANNLKQMALAAHDYNSVHQSLPPVALINRERKPLLSWRVLLLPYLEHKALYDQFKLDEPWDSPHNKPLLAKMPMVYALGGDVAQANGLTHYEVFSSSEPGIGTPFRLPRQFVEGELPKTQSIQSLSNTDGAANTILIVESPNPVPWTKPTWLDYAPDKPLPKLDGLWGRSIKCQIALCDGSFRRLSTDLSEQTLRNAITGDDGKVLGTDW